DQLVPDLGRAACEVLQTVVAHGAAPVRIERPYGCSGLRNCNSAPLYGGGFRCPGVHAARRMTVAPLEAKGSRGAKVPWGRNFLPAAAIRPPEGVTQKSHSNAAVSQIWSTDHAGAALDRGRCATMGAFAAARRRGIAQCR